MIPALDIGHQAEDLARQFLEKQGLTLVARNFSCRMGEIDLIMRHKQFVVFVEVRFRKNRDFGGPVISISKSKQNKLLATAKIYLQQNPRLARIPVRFDVIGILGSDDSVEWVQNAIDAEGDLLTYDYSGFHDTDCFFGGPIDAGSVPSRCGMRC